MNYFLTPVWIKDNMPVNGNIEDKNIVPQIKLVVDMRIKDILGKYFYNYLLTKFNAQTLNNYEIELVEIIKYAIGWSVTMELTKSLSFQLQNKGVQTQSGDYSASSDFKPLSYLIKDYNDKGRFYETSIVDFLKDNKDKFPELTDKQNNSIAIIECENPNRFENQIYFM